MLIFLIVLFFLLVKGLCVVLKVEQPDKRTVETVGLPVTIWCNVMKNNPDALPEETSDFMYELASREAYENIYVVGSFNAIKFSGAIDTIKIDSLSYGEVLNYTWQCFRYAPKESLQALAKLTDMVWAVDGKDGPKNVLVGDNSWGIVQNPYPKAAKLVYQFKNFFTSGFGKILFGSFGLELLVLLIISAGMFAKKRCSFIHILPLFCYDFGTMLLLSGRDYRFFLFNIPLWLPVLFLMFRDDRGMKSDAHPAENERKEVSA